MTILDNFIDKHLNWLFEDHSASFRGVDDRGSWFTEVTIQIDTWVLGVFTGRDMSMLYLAPLQHTSPKVGLRPRIDVEDVSLLIAGDGLGDPLVLPDCPQSVEPYSKAFFRYWEENIALESEYLRNNYAAVDSYMKPKAWPETKRRVDAFLENQL